MKRALALLAACSLFGFVGFAQFSGSWDLTVGLLPAVTLDTSLTLEYTFSGWVFSSVSSFNDADGFSSQKFTLSGNLGAVAVDAEMVFLPGSTWAVWHAATQTVSTTVCPVYDKTYTWTDGPAMDYFKATFSLSFAGVDTELLMYQCGYAHDFFEAWDLIDSRTGAPTGYYVWVYDPGYALGTGFRLKIGSTFNDITITSYTYFNLVETVKLLDTDGCPTITLKGDYKVAGCNILFSSQLVTLEGLSMCCGMTVNAALSIGCYGFEYLYVYVEDIPWVGGLTLTPWVKFTVDAKEFGFCGDIAGLGDCFTVSTVLIWVGEEAHNEIPNMLEGLAIKEISFTCELSECLSFSAGTILYDLTTNAYYTIDGAAVPWEVAFTVNEQYIGSLYLCKPDVQYFAWEKFSLSFCGPGCCGGEWTVDTTTYFGKGYEIDAWVCTIDATPAEEEIPSPPETPTESALKCTPTYGDEVQLGTLFGWMMTEVSASVPLTGDISLTLDLGVSFLGVEYLDVGFSFQF